MNRTTRLLAAAALGLALIGNTQAGDRHYRDDYRPRHYDRHHERHYQRHHFRHHYDHHAPRVPHRHHRDWVGPAALIALSGIAIGAAVSHLPPAPPVAYSAPPPPSGNWYYCGSSDQYYPYTNACPEGWQTVRPR